MAGATRAKLGELLLQNGLISEEQLQKALATQVVQAGRLGSNIVELGYSSIDAVADLLSFQLGVPAVMPGQIAAIEPQVIAALPAQVCAKYKILPFQLVGRTLHLAMQDPLRLDLINYLASGLRVRIEPYVVPQLRLLYCLERYYGIARPKRFLREAAPSPQPHDERRTYLSPTVAAGSSSSSTVSTAPPPPPQPVAAPPANTAAAGGIELVYLDEVPRSAPEDAFDIDVETEQEAAAAGPSSPPSVLEQIQQASSRDALIRALVQPVIPRTTLSLLLLPRGDNAVALAAWGSSLSAEQIRSLVVPLGTPSLLQRALAELGPAYGINGDDPLQETIATFLQVPEPRHFCVVPIVLSGRVLNLSCIQSEDMITEDHVQTLSDLAAHAAKAYDRLIRSNVRP